MKFYKHKPDIAEIDKYVSDLERVTALRDRVIKVGRVKETERYDRMIEVMQLCLIELTK